MSFIQEYINNSAYSIFSETGPKSTGNVTLVTESETNPGKSGKPPDEPEGKMYCRVCKKYETTGTFVTGCSNFKIESIKAHDTSAGHQKIVIKEANTKENKANSIAHKGLLALNKAVGDRLKILFRTCHGIAKYSRPFKDYVWITTMDEMKDIS